MCIRDRVKVPTRRIVGTSPSGDGTVMVQAPSYVRSSLLGVAFAAGWTPCIGPTLGGIIGLASLGSSVAQGTVLLFAYAFGLGVPFILVAVCLLYTSDAADDLTRVDLG